MQPNFLIFGTQKAGTTWLARRLEEHPDIFLTAEKELHFFNHRFDRGLAWYETHFEERRDEKMAGEATPGYLNSSDAPERIKTVLGADVKLIASLRHPVDRAYSAFWHYTTRGKLPLDADFRDVFTSDNAFGIRDRGFYGQHLSRYFDCFPRENLLIMIFEKWKKDNEKTLSQCLSFLDVDDQFKFSLVHKRTNHSQDIRQFQGKTMAIRNAVKAKVNLLPREYRQNVLRVGAQAYKELVLRWLPKKQDYQSLDPSLRQELLQTYMSDIHQLEDLLKQDLSIWYREDSSPLSKSD